MVWDWVSVSVSVLVWVWLLAFVWVWISVSVWVWVWLLVWISVSVLVWVSVSVLVWVLALVWVLVLVWLLVFLLVLLFRRSEMKRLIEEVDGEGLVGLMGQRITLFCLNYIYTGDLVGVNTDCVKLSNPAIIYETGAFTEKQWKDAQALPHEMYIMLSAVESFGVVK